VLVVTASYLVVEPAYLVVEPAYLVVGLVVVFADLFCPIWRMIITTLSQVIKMYFMIYRNNDNC
jgi:hypothetical protein